MKFYNLKKGDKFQFTDSLGDTYISAGVDGMYGRYVAPDNDWLDPTKWMYCAANEDVKRLR